MIYTLLAYTSMLPGTMQLCVPCDPTPMPQPVPYVCSDTVKIDREALDALLTLAEQYIYEFERGAISGEITIMRLKEILECINKIVEIN